VAVLRDRGAENIKRVLVPVGGGPHSRLALRLARDIVNAEGGTMTALRILPEKGQVDMEVETDVLHQLVEDALGEVPEEMIFRLRHNASVVEGILAESTPTEGQDGYDLIAIGASEEWFLTGLLFGSIPDLVADAVSCSVLMVRKHEPAAISRVRRLIKGHRP